MSHCPKCKIPLTPITRTLQSGTTERLRICSRCGYTGDGFRPHAIDQALGEATTHHAEPPAAAAADDTGWTSDDEDQPAGIDLFSNPLPAEPQGDAEACHVTRLGTTIATLAILLERLRATADHTGRVAHTRGSVRKEDVAAVAAHLRDYRRDLGAAIEELRDLQQDLAARGG